MKKFFFFLFIKLKYGREQSRGISESLSMGHIALLIPTSKKGLISCISAGTLALVIIRFFQLIDANPTVRTIYTLYKPNTNEKNIDCKACYYTLHWRVMLLLFCPNEMYHYPFLLCTNFNKTIIPLFAKSNDSQDKIQIFQCLFFVMYIKSHIY